MYLGYTMDITVISSVDDNILEKKLLILEKISAIKDTEGCQKSAL